MSALLFLADILTIIITAALILWGVRRTARAATQAEEARDHAMRAANFAIHQLSEVMAHADRIREANQTLCETVTGMRDELAARRAAAHRRNGRPRS